MNFDKFHAGVEKQTNLKQLIYMIHINNTNPGNMLYALIR